MINFFISNLKLNGNVLVYICYAFILANFFGLLCFLHFQPSLSLGKVCFRNMYSSSVLCPYQQLFALEVFMPKFSLLPCLRPLLLKGLLQPDQGSVLQSKGGPVPLLRLLEGRSERADFNNSYEFWTILPSTSSKAGRSFQAGWLGTGDSNTNYEISLI